MFIFLFFIEPIIPFLLESHQNSLFMFPVKNQFMIKQMNSDWILNFLSEFWIFDSPKTIQLGYLVAFSANSFRNL